MAVQSKLTPIKSSCVEYVHPWQPSCTIATAGLILQAGQYSFRTYSAVYMISVLMRCKIPNISDIRRTILGIIQSTAFLTTSAFTYCLFLCIIRHYVGSLNYFTASYIPAFMSSVCALLIERPSRRGILCLYVSNVATETLFRMAVVRGICQPIKYGQVLLFGASISILLYFYRESMYVSQNDSIFDIIRFVVGDSNDDEMKLHKYAIKKKKQQQEEKLLQLQQKQQEQEREHQNIKQSHRKFSFIMNIIRIYKNWIKSIKKYWIIQPMCSHENGCGWYVAHKGLKLFSIGLGIQILLKLIFKMKMIIKFGPGYLFKLLFSGDTLRLGVFLGGFSSLFRLSSCILRNSILNKKRYSSWFVIPAGLIASCAFFSYPDTTVALYVMWKMLQISYNIGLNYGYLPKIPHFTFFLYCASTALLFHAATMEPLTLRQNYWKFLHSLSGGRLAGMNRDILDIYGYDTSKQLAEALMKTKTTNFIKFKL